MTASRPFDTGPGAVPAPARADSWDSQRSTAGADIAHLHMENLNPPTSQRSLMPTELLSHPAHVTHGPPALHPPLPAPELPPPLGPDPWDPWTAAIAEHLRVAQRLHEEANQLHDTLTVYSGEANAASQRWFTLMHTQQRTPEHVVVCAQLENQILAFSRELASLRQRWSACMPQAREHEDAARRMQSGS
jgi:hypothetical protein